MNKLAQQDNDSGSDEEDKSADSSTLDGEKSNEKDDEDVEKEESRRPSRPRWRPEDEALEMYEAREEDWARDEQPVNSRFQAIRTPATSRPKRPGSQGSRYSSVYNESPYDIDRVNTRDSFRRQRSSSRPGTAPRIRGERTAEHDGACVGT